MSGDSSSEICPDCGASVEVSLKDVETDHGVIKMPVYWCETCGVNKLFAKPYVQPVGFVGNDD